MTTLTITKTYASGDAFMEADLDNFRTGLHTLFNTDKLSSGNFSGSLVLTSAKFSGGIILSTDNTDIDFGSVDDAFLGMDASKNMYWNTTASSTELKFWAGSTYYLEVYTDKVYAPADILVGGTTKSILYALSKYKKPVLEWSSSTAVVLQCNSETSTETVIVFPTFIATVQESSPSKYRYSAVSAAANGYGTGDTGTALGGRRSGVALTDNSWYAVYACKLRSGTDYSATSNKFILVYDTTLPTADNVSTLDGYYGNGCWVYMGLIRYGTGVAGSATQIPKFVYSNKGWCRFYSSSSPGYGGVDLAYSTADTDDTAAAFYTMASGMSGAVIPSTVGSVALNLTREMVSDWYVKDTSGDIIWRGGWQSDESTLPHGHSVELPFVTTYGVYQSRTNAGAVVRCVTLMGFSDTCLILRKQGHGI